MKKITLKTINLFDPCYDPKEIGFTSKMSLTPVEFIDQFKDKVENKADIIWLLCRKEFMSERDQRLFGVWCAREALKLIESPDEKSINSCDVAERFANGKATQEELSAAESAAESAAWSAESAAWSAARSAARSARSAAWSAESAARSATRSAAWSAESAAWSAARSARSAAWSAQIEQLKTYFK